MLLISGGGCFLCNLLRLLFLMYRCIRLLRISQLFGCLVFATLLHAGAGLPSQAKAQPSSEFQQWTAIINRVRLSENEPRGMLWLDVHARRGSEQVLVLVRPGLGVQVAPWLSLWGGYAWIPRIQAEGPDTNEHRFWQQLSIKIRPQSNVLLVLRTRFEQRFSDAGNDVGYRFRQFLRAKWRPDDTIPVGVTVWDEVFLGLNSTDWGTPGGFDQNRLFIGPFFPLENWGRFEIGYLWASLERGGGRRSQHALSATLFISPVP